nr:BldC family transcriptional regulator [Cellulosimicrobium cellulans]
MPGESRRGDELLTPGEVAALFGVGARTVANWSKSGRLKPLRTLGGHRRYRAREVEALLARKRTVVPDGG